MHIQAQQQMKLHIDQQADKLQNVRDAHSKIASEAQIKENEITSMIQ